MSSSAIAINTQRFAPNTMTVVAADEYGPVASHNIGNVLTNVPGITVQFGGLGNPNVISMNGAPSANVPLMINGMQLAHSVDGAGSRSVSTNNLSINNMSRVEIVFTPTPETPGSALAGSINLIPRSSFDRAKPTYTYAVAAVMRDRERTLKRTPGMGGRGDPTYKVTPELSFSSVVPLNDRLGFTFSGSSTTTLNQRSNMQHFWRGVFNDTNGGTYTDTTPDRPSGPCPIRQRHHVAGYVTAAGPRQPHHRGERWDQTVEGANDQFAARILFWRGRPDFLRRVPARF